MSSFNNLAFSLCVEGIFYSGASASRLKVKLTISFLHVGINFALLSKGMPSMKCKNLVSSSAVRILDLAKLILAACLAGSS
jgi:hypothetical protein